MERNPIITVGILVGVMVIMGIKHQQWDWKRVWYLNMMGKPWKTTFHPLIMRISPMVSVTPIFFGPSVAQARQRSEFHSCQARTKSIHEIWKKKESPEGGWSFGNAWLDVRTRQSWTSLRNALENIGFQPRIIWFQRIVWIGFVGKIETGKHVFF